MFRGTSVAEVGVQSPVATPIYHITHIGNLPSMLQADGLLSYSACARLGIGHSDIAHQHIQQRRARTQVPCSPGGTLHDYVPFYFAPRPPMLYAIVQGGVEGYAEGQRPILHLVSTAQAVEAAGCEWVFTDGHAAMAISEYYNNLADLNKVDWEVMTARYWRNTEDDNDRKRRRQAEFLVKNRCPWGLICQIGVLDSEMEKQVLDMLCNVPHKPLVKVCPRWYY